MTQKQEAHARRMQQENRTKNVLEMPRRSDYDRERIAVAMRAFERTPIVRPPFPPLDKLLAWANRVKEARDARLSR